MKIHPTAIISEDARLGSDITIGPYAVVEPNTEIGHRTEVRSHAVIKRFTTIGPENVIHEGAVLGGIQNLKEACRLLLRSGLSLEGALSRLAALKDPLVDHLIDFVRKSQRGFCRE